MLIVFLLLINDLPRLSFSLGNCCSCSRFSFCSVFHHLYLHKHHEESLVVWLVSVMIGFKFDNILLASLCYLIKCAWRVNLLLINNKISYRIVIYTHTHHLLWVYINPPFTNNVILYWGYGLILLLKVFGNVQWRHSTSSMGTKHSRMGRTLTEHKGSVF